MRPRTPLNSSGIWEIAVGTRHSLSGPLRSSQGYLACYELESAAVMQTPAFTNRPQTPWGQTLSPSVIGKNLTRIVGEQIYPDGVEMPEHRHRRPVPSGKVGEPDLLRREAHAASSCNEQPNCSAWSSCHGRGIAGDYYQLLLEAEEDSDDPESPYLILQRQFETEDSGRCSVETHDEKFHRTIHPGAHRVHPRTALDQPNDKEIVATFGLSHSEFEKNSQILKIINGEINPFD